MSISVIAEVVACSTCPRQAQIQQKQSVLLEQFTHISVMLTPEVVLPPLTSPVFGYRHKARLAVKYVIKKEKVLVGFREKRSPFVADIDKCKVLHPAVGEKVKRLAGHYIESLSVYNQIPQIEVAVSDCGVALVIRHLENFNDADIKLLNEFEQVQQLQALSTTRRI